MRRRTPGVRCTAASAWYWSHSATTARLCCLGDAFGLRHVAHVHDHLGIARQHVLHADLRIRRDGVLEDVRAARDFDDAVQIGRAAHRDQVLDPFGARPTMNIILRRGKRGGPRADLGKLPLHAVDHRAALAPRRRPRPRCAASRRRRRPRCRGPLRARSECSARRRAARLIGLVWITTRSGLSRRDQFQVRFRVGADLRLLARFGRIVADTS